MAGFSAFASVEGQFRSGATGSLRPCAWCYAPMIATSHGIATGGRWILGSAGSSHQPLAQVRLLRIVTAEPPRSTSAIERSYNRCHIRQSEHRVGAQTVNLLLKQIAACHR